MYFTQDKHLRELEKLMQCVPNFRPRGQGVIVMEVTESPLPGYTDIMTATVSAVKCLLAAAESTSDGKRDDFDDV